MGRKDSADGKNTDIAYKEREEEEPRPRLDENRRDR